MSKFYFTFGCGHYNGDGEPLGNRYCAIESPSEVEARQSMLSKRGIKWAMCYTEEEKPKAVDRWELIPIKLDQLSPQQEENNLESQ